MCNLNVDKQTQMSLYADDTAVFNNNVSLWKVQENLQNDFDLISQWLENNDMHLHPIKTKVIIFGPKRKIHNKHITIKFNDVELENTDTIKYLGIVLDSQLLWNKHIRHVRNKLCRSIWDVFAELNTYYPVRFWLICIIPLYCHTLTIALQHGEVVQKQI